MGYQVELEPKWIVLNRKRHPDTCILCLPGRYGHAANLCGCYQQVLGIRSSLIVGVTPTHRCWYPMPNGANDQDDALIGQRYARKLINRVVRKIENGTGIPRERMILAGFSAGAVMAIQVAACSEKPFAGVICHSGAILNPDALPRCRCQDTDFLLTHCVDDVIFEWYERYLPMKNALKEKGYTVWTVEEWEGYHSITDRQLLMTKSFIEAVLKNKKRE